MLFQDVYIKILSLLIEPILRIDNVCKRSTVYLIILNSSNETINMSWTNNNRFKRLYKFTIAVNIMLEPDKTAITTWITKKWKNQTFILVFFLLTSSYKLKTYKFLSVNYNHSIKVTHFSDRRAIIIQRITIKRKCLELSNFISRLVVFFYFTNFSSSKLIIRKYWHLTKKQIISE